MPPVRLQVGETKAYRVRAQLATTIFVQRQLERILSMEINWCLTENLVRFKTALRGKRARITEVTDVSSIYCSVWPERSFPCCSVAVRYPPGTRSSLCRKTGVIPQTARAALRNVSSSRVEAVSKLNFGRHPGENLGPASL